MAGSGRLGSKGSRDLIRWVITTIQNHVTAMLLYYMYMKHQLLLNLTKVLLKILSFKVFIEMSDNSYPLDAVNVLTRLL